MHGVRELVTMLTEPKLSLARVRELARAIDEAESEADTLVAAAERRLVARISGTERQSRSNSSPGKNSTSCSEQMTDEANHCGKLILSLARKEA